MLRAAVPQAGHVRSGAATGAVLPLLRRIESGDVRVLLHETFPLTRAAEAHRMMESSAHIGKLALLVESWDSL